MKATLLHFVMSASNTFVLQSAEKFAQARLAEDHRFIAERDRMQDVHQQSMQALDQREERYLAFIEPVLRGLANLPDGLTIDDIQKNTSGEALVVLSAAPGASMASMLLEYAPLPFVVLDSGKMCEPDANADNQAVYDGVLIEGTKAEIVHWQSEVGGSVVHFSCRTNGVSLDPWRNPVVTGQPVASVALGDLPMAAWVQENNYWVNPASDVARARLEKAIAWRQQQQVDADIAVEFNAALESISKSRTPQGKILFNALLHWAKTDQPLPTVQDFSAWKTPSSNVIAMRGQQDWDKLLVGTTFFTANNPVQEKIQSISARLPNFWRFVEPSQVELVCNAMAMAQTRWLGAPSQAQPTTP